MNNDPFQQDKQNTERDWTNAVSSLYAAIDAERDALYRKIKHDSGRTSIRRKVKRETFLSSLKDGFDSIIDGLNTFKFW